MSMIFPRSILYLILGLAVSGMGVAVHHYYQQALLWREKALLADERISQQAAILEKARQQQHILAELDTRLIEELSHEENDNTVLRHQLITGAQRLRIAGHCASPHHQSSAASSVGHGTTVEIAGNTGQDILTLREGIIHDRKKLIYLQEYIKRVCSPINR